jgi:hypothetical protein
MDMVTFIFDLLKIIIPALIVFFTAFFILKSYLENEFKKKLLDGKIGTQNTILPLRLQAYERLTLFLERISPNNMIMRVHQTGMTARELQSILLADIRAEFEHNLSQQLYVSQNTWNIVRSVKEETVSLINNATAGLPSSATGMDLSKIIIEHVLKQEKNPYQLALTLVKNEVQQLF